MKHFFYFFSAIIFYGFSGCISHQGGKSGFSNDIQPYTDNLKYWQYKGQPVLLLGGSNNDNLFQSPDVEEQLDLLQSMGGNFVRNTMSSRDSGDVWPFFRMEDGKYDLNKWNEEYWVKFENLLKLTTERNIIIQIEVWDRFDYSMQFWALNPFNPANNTNYSEDECGMATEYTKHPSSDLQPFFHSINGMPNYSPALELVKKYQEKLVDKMLSYSLNYGNVLYCMDNETSTPPEWGLYWMNYIKGKAGKKQVYVTDMFDHFFKPNSCETCKQAIYNPEEYLFLDVSQNNSRNFDQAHWDTLQWIVSERDKYALRPINCTKTYGGGNSSWGSGSNEDGVERFCRSVMGGCAAVRHHRPTSGNGLNEKAQATIKSFRKAESLAKMWELEPHMELLSEREDNEAYLTALVGEKYVILFPKGGAVKIDLKNYGEKFSGKWVSIKTGKWGEQFSVTGGVDVEISTPDATGWFAVLFNAN
jgi:hypothetical protein